ncbi:MAG: aspartyl protease family protein [Burkholderiaceae bacterium]
MSLNRRALVQTGARFAACCAVLPLAWPQETLAADVVALQVTDYPLSFVPISIDGEPVRALLDSGSSTALRLSARLAARLNLALTPRPNDFVHGLDGRRIALQHGRIQRFSVGPITQEAVEVEVAGERIEGIAAQVGTAFDAVLGWGFLSRWYFVLDYPARRLLLASSAGAPAAMQGMQVSVVTTQGLPVLQGRIGDAPAGLLLDTGAPMCNIDQALSGAPSGSVVTRDLTVGNLRLPIQWRVKDLSAQRRAVDTAGTLGNNFLMRYTITFDPVRGIARFA